MAFNIDYWSHVSTTANTRAPLMFTYTSSSDTLATITTSAYFNSLVPDLTNGVGAIKVDDLIYIVGSDDDMIARVTAVTTNVTVTEFEVAVIANNSVTTAKIADEAVTDAKIDKDANGYTDLSTPIDLTSATRPTPDYAYMFNMNGSGFMTGGAAQKTYILNISATRPDGSAATGDSNDAVIKTSVRNLAACDSNFILRSLNTAANNGSSDGSDPGTLGILEGCSFGVKNSSGSTAPTVRGVTIRNENYGTNATEFGVLDVNSSDEVGAATLRYGVRIRNTDASAVAAMGHAILINASATNGWNNAITVQNAVDTFADFDDATGAVCTQTGSAATTWAARIKVVTPDGNDGWINVYSTSNA